MFVIGGGSATATLGDEISPGVFEVFGVLQTGAGNNGRYGIQRISGSARRGFVVTAYDVRPSNQSNLPYQRVNTSTDYDSAGFPIYIKPNGSNQSMQTNSINFTATDKMTVWQGVRALSDTGFGAILELSVAVNSNVGSFGLFTPLGGAFNGYYSGGSITGNAVQASRTAAPFTEVVTGISSISNDVMTLRLNGTQVATNGADQGTGNYGTYPAYFYSRAGTMLFFNGNDYGSIARGAASTAAQITAGETYINSKTKAY